MALIKCRECGKKVSEKAQSCPNCGAQPKKKTSYSAWHVLILIAIAFLAQALSGIQERNDHNQRIREQQKRANQIAYNNKVNTEYFQNNRDKIISSLRTHLTNEDYRSVISQSHKYLVTKDEDLLEIYSKAKSIQSKIQKDNEISEILAKLDGTPKTDFKELKKLYNELAHLNPESIQFREMVEVYTSKEEEQIKIAEAKEARTILSKLKRIPMREYKANLDLYSRLLELYPSNEKYKKKHTFYLQKYRDRQAGDFNWMSLSNMQQKQLTLFATKALAVTNIIERRTLPLAQRDIDKMIANNKFGDLIETGIILNGYLCSKVVLVTPLKVKGSYEVECIKYRGGHSKTSYIVNALDGLAFPP